MTATNKSIEDLISIRRINPEKDMDILYRIYSDYKEQHKLFDIMNLNSPERFPVLFERRLSNNYCEFFIVENDKGNFLGFVFGYDLSVNDGHVKIVLYIDEKYRSSIYCALIAIKTIDLFFKYYNIRKIYTEVYGYNQESIRANLSFGFVEEARLKEFRFYDNRYWDYIYYSITREEFYKRYGRFVVM